MGFFIALYQDDQLMDPRYLTVDSDLNVRLTTDVNKRKIYRLAFCIIQQLSGLSATALPAIETYSLGEIISDTINLLASRFDTKVLGNEIVLPKDLTSVGYLRTISPIVTGWTETGEPYLTRNPRGIVTQRTVMDTWVTVIRK